MAAHADILDQKEPLGRWLAGSLILHGSLVAAIVGYTLIHHTSVENWGEKNGGGMGAMAVNIVPTIKLPTSGPANPVANETESHVPEAKVKPQPKVKAPEPDADAIAIKSRNAPKKSTRPAREYAPPPNKFREQQVDQPNQLHSTQGQQLSSNMFAMTGGGGVGIGTDSPLGSRFGYYANIIRTKVAQNWHTNEVDRRVQTAPEAVVRFTLRKDGSVAPGSVKIAQSSGIAPLDNSAQRAIYDASPFGNLPPQFEKDQADLELHFILRR